MDRGLVVRGFLLGFAVAAPVGPIGVLVIRRTLALGPRTGFVSGLGAATADAGGSRGGLWTAYVSTLLLTVTNPMTILSFAAAFAGLGLADGVTEPGAGLPLVAAVFLGSLCSWAVLSGAVGLLRGTIEARALRAVNWAAGLLLVGFGLMAVAGLRK